MKIKIIDLLNKIANGKTPPKIKFKNTKPIFEYNIRNGKYECCYKSNKGKNEICELTFLNLKDEIEIIEEEKKIELPEKMIHNNNYLFSNTQNGMTKEDRRLLDSNFKEIGDKINGILDYLKYKEEESKKWRI